MNDSHQEGLPQGHNPACVDLKVLHNSAQGTQGLFHLHLEPVDWEWQPGQFVMVRPPGWGRDPVWPRPFSISDLDQNSLRLFIQVMGRGTSLLAGLRPGDRVTVWGPLGLGFHVPAGKPTLLLAGGIGIAPFVGLVRRHPSPDQLALLLGHRLGLDDYPFAFFSSSIEAQALRQTTQSDIEDFVLVLEERFSSLPANGLVLACGPAPFLRVVQRLALSTGIRTQLSLENRMACGVGACLGCVVQDSRGELVQTCIRGPVFWADEVRLP